MQDGYGSTLLTVKTRPPASAPYTVLIQVDETDIDVTNDPWVGAYMYCVDSSDSSFIGKKSQIVRVVNDSGGDIFSFADNNLGGIPDDSKLSLSPVYFRWVGHPLTVTSDDSGRAMVNLHRTKQMDSLGCSFVDVSSPGSSYDAYSRFNGQVFEGSLSPTPKSENWVVDQDAERVQSVMDGEGSRWVSFGIDTTLGGNYGVIGGTLSPAVEIILSDLDFRLMSVLVNGKILPSYRSDFPSTT